MNDLFNEYLRQYRHNSGDGHFVFGYDKSIRQAVEDRIAALEMQVSNQAEIIQDLQLEIDILKNTCDDLVVKGILE